MALPSGYTIALVGFSSIKQHVGSFKICISKILKDLSIHFALLNESIVENIACLNYSSYLNTKGKLKRYLQFY